MNKHLKDFLLRGLMFGGLGPIVLGIVYMILDLTLADFYVTGADILVAIISTYIIAFVQAGVTVFKEVEGWSTVKSLALHLCSLYLVYVLAYLVNSWIPFEPIVLLVFTAIFVTAFLVIWISVFAVVKLTERRMNESLD